MYCDLKSWEGGATSERGGRRKKYYLLTSHGQRTLEEAHQLRLELAKCTIMRFGFQSIKAAVIHPVTSLRNE